MYLCNFFSFHVYVLGGGEKVHIFDETFLGSLYRQEVRKMKDEKMKLRVLDGMLFLFFRESHRVSKLNQMKYSPKN